MAFAAGLVAMVARATTEAWEDAAGISAQALAVQGRAAALARVDAEAWERAVAALSEGGGEIEEEGRRNFDLEQRLDLAAAIPLEIAELAAVTAELAAVAAERGEPAYRADAAAAAALAAGGARAATHLVEVNLVVREGEDRLVRARASEQTAMDAAARILETNR